MCCHKNTQVFQILPPVIIGISDVLVAVLIATGYGVEIREVARVGKNGNSDDNESDNADAP